MTEIELGPVTVALVQVPSGKAAPGAAAPAPDYLFSTDEDEVRSLPRPARLPAGLDFLDATLFRAPAQVDIWTYADQASGRSLTLVRTGTDALPRGAAGSPVVYVPGQDLREAKIAGGTAVHVVISEDPAWRGPRTTFVWMKDDSVLQISGRGLSDQELEETAASI